MEINQTLGYHERSICRPSFKGGKKGLDVVLFSLRRSRSVQYKVGVL